MVIEYLREEIRVLKGHVGPRRLRFTDEQRSRLAAKAKKLRFGRLKEIARNITDCMDGFLKDYKYLIHDRGPQFSKAFKMILVGGGVKRMRLPRRRPNLNPIAERWLCTAKELCIYRMIFFGENSLRSAIGNFVEHTTPNGPTNHWEPK